ncbi:MAG: TIR domain-containing protein [Eggerthia catenaformis]|uniref:TIR domain-containing protein n=1 Tax=Eggerthia catenaformis TaxID=31973 RepID=UPI003F9F45CF
MGHKCFVSFKKEDQAYRNALDNLLDESDLINKGLDRVIDSSDGDYIMQVIRNDYLKDSTVTIFLIGKHSSENEGYDYQWRDKNYFIKRELQASMYNGKGNIRNGILGVVLPNMYDSVYHGSYECSTCGHMHQYVNFNDSTVIREFSKNYYIEPHFGCGWSEDERYCIAVKWEDFIKNPEKYVNRAFDKRTEDIASKIKIKNLR